MHGAIDIAGSGGPGGLEFRPDNWRSRRLLPESGNLVRAAPTFSEVIEKVAEHSRGVPPPEDLLRVTAAAARYALTSLDSARQIAAEIRAEQASRRAEEAVSAAASAEMNRAEIAEAMGV